MEITDDDIIFVLKTVSLIGLVFSTGLMLHYHFNVKQVYENNSQVFQKDKETLENYLRVNGCSSRSEVFFNTGLGYIQVWELMHIITETGEAYARKNKKVCLGPRLTPEDKYNRSHYKTNYK
jgi:hypothetical protein